MPSFLNQQVSPPEFWQEFEKLSADLWGRIWNDPNAQMHGRSGQAQQGVDVFGRKEGDGDLVGVQCKGKDGRYGKKVTEEELKAEVEKAKNFEPPLREFILATTAENDGEIQKVARQITADHEGQGLFRVTVFGWSEIHRRLAEYPDLIDKHFPGHGPGLNRVEKRVETILERQLVSEEQQNELAREFGKEFTDETIGGVRALFVTAGLLADSDDFPFTPADRAVNAEIDGYRDLLRDHQARTALGLLEQLRKRHWETASDWIKFRILTNIAAAHLYLGEKEKASDEYLEAEQYAPHDEKAACNVAMAHLLIEDDSKAQAASRKAIEAHPESARAFSLVVSSSIWDESINKPEDIVPARHLESSEVAYSLSHFYRKRGKTEEAATWSRKAFALDSDQLEVRGSYATTLLETFIDARSSIDVQARSEAQREVLGEAAEIFQGIWDEVKNTETATEHLQFAINLITVERLRENFEGAKEVASEALLVASDSLELMRQKAIVALELGEPMAACEVLATIPEGDSAGNALLHAEALAQTEQYEDALERVNYYLQFGDDENELAVAAGSRLRLLREVSGDEAAISAVGETIADYPDSIVVRVNAASLLRECGNKSRAKKQIEAAMELIGPKTERGEKLAVADELFFSKEYEIAAAMYNDLVSLRSNTQSLRRLLICLYENDSRKELSNLLEKIPSAVRKLGFFRRIAAAVYARVGDLDAALNEMGAYLALEPNDLNVRLNWISALQRKGKRDKVEAFLSAVSDYPDADPIDRLNLAHVFDQFGHFQKALNLAYSVRREFPEFAEVHLLYMGLFLMGGAGGIVKEPTEVAAETAFFIENKNGVRSSYFITEDLHCLPIEGQISPDHLLQFLQSVRE